MLEGVTIEQLRTLRAVAEAGSFSAAARKLGRVQAAVSQSIDRLEAQLGLRLFDRSGRVPRLTRHGEAIASAASKIEGEVDALDHLVESLKRGEETTLSIVVDYFFPTTSLVAFATEFAREYPTVELLLYTEVLSSVTALVRDRRATWGIAIEDADMSELDRKPIADVRLVPVAAATHPLARIARIAAESAAGESATIDRAALADAIQIVLGEHRREDALPASREPHDPRQEDPDHGIFSPRTWRVIDLATKHALITSGLGWGNMPEHLVRADLEAGRLVSLKLDAFGGEPMKRSLMLVWKRGAVMGPVARWAEARLSDLCQKAIATVPPKP